MGRQIIILRALLLSCVFLAAVVPLSLAHLDAGEDKSVNGYIVDFGYAPAQPKYSDAVTMSFNLVNETTQEVVSPGRVWIRISDSKEIVFSGTFYPEAQHVVFEYRFPAGGDYGIDTTFYDGKGVLVKTSFQLHVGGGNSSWYMAAYALVAGIAIGTILYFAIGSRKRRKGKAG
jgi:hypothetical protein